MRTRCILLLTLLVAAGCGGGSDDDVLAGPTTSSEAASTTSTADLASTSTSSPATSGTTRTTTLVTTPTTAQATTTTEGSPLRRRDSRPTDVAAQAEYYLGGPPPKGFFCEQDLKPATSPPTGALAIVPDLLDMVAGEATTICVGNYEIGVPVMFEVSFQGRSIWKAEVPKPVANLGPSAIFNTMPLDPSGAYTVKVTQKTRQATETFQLGIAPNGPFLVVAESPGRGVPRTVRGKPVRIGLAGWAPRKAVELVLYRSTSSEPGGEKAPATFITRFSVTTDARGQQIHVLQTRADDPTGCYVVNTRPRVEPTNLALGRLGPSIVEFCLA